MFSKTKIALSAAIVLSATFPALAATTNYHDSHAKRSAIYNMVPAYSAPRGPSAASGFEAPDRFGIESQR
jgi:hypothetical protein